MVLCTLSSLVAAATAVACTDPVSTACPSALAAAQALTNSDPQLPVSNAVFSGARDPSADAKGIAYITDFGDCHYLAPIMPHGENVMTRSWGSISDLLSVWQQMLLKLH